MFYILGLGNPGEKYEGTRHNVGRTCVRWVADQNSHGDWTKDKHAQALSVNCSLAGDQVTLLLPETFMNKSGETARYIVEKLEAKLEDIIVVHDDVDLALGEIKISQGRGAGGNNGVQSIIDALKSKDFVRIRVGISPTSFWTGKTKRPTGGGQLESFVLKPFGRVETTKLETVKEKVEEALKLIMKEGVERAMNQFN